MGTVTVRVVPRAGRTRVGSDRTGTVVHVRAAPEAGRATEEARRALAEALGVRPYRVRLVTGARSRTKVFEVDGLDEAAIAMRLRTTGVP
jgi:hypothetical protein